MILGLATPLAASLALALSAYLTMFGVVDSGNGVRSLLTAADGTVTVQLLLTLMAVAVQFTGPGRIGVDFTRGWARRPLASSWIFIVVSIAATIGLWWVTTNTLPILG